MAAAVVEGRNGTIIRVHVTPRSRREEILQGGDELRVRLTALPAGGQANQALIKLLARVLGVPRRDLEIASGSTSRRKSVRVRSLAVADVAGRLAGWIAATAPIAAGKSNRR